MTDLTHDGITQPISEWAADYGIPCKLIRSRLRRGWSVERAITEPMQVWRGEKLKVDDLEDKPAPAPLAVSTCPATPIVHPWRSEAKPLRLKRSGPIAKRSGPIAKRVTYNGETLTVHQWATRIGIHSGALYGRLKAGWPLERALSIDNALVRRGPAPKLLTFNGETLPLRQWADRLGVCPTAITNRLNRMKWSVERALSTPLLPREERNKSPREPIQADAA